MDGIELWQVFIGGIAVPVIAYWLKDGVANFVKTRRARRERLAEDERAASVQEKKDTRRRCAIAEARVRVLDDYAHELRAHIDRQDPPPPPPWPPHIITDDQSH